MKRALSVLLASLLFLQALVACSETPAENTPETPESAPAVSEASAEQQTDEGEPVTSVEEEPDLPKDNLPEGLDYGGAAAVFYTNPYTPYAVNLAEDMNGEALNDAKYQIELNVEERLNVVISEEYGNNSPYTFDGQVKALILAGDTTYSYMTNEDYIMMPNITAGSFYAISDVEYLDLAAEYWLPEATALYEIGGKIWYAFCPLNLYANQNTNLIAVNLELAESIGLGGYYDRVREGTWTFDVLTSDADAAYADLDGDGNRGGSDRFGFMIDELPGKNLWCGITVACGCQREILDKDENGYFVYGYTPHLIDTLELAYNTYHHFLDNASIPAFAKGQTLFADTRFNQVTTGYRNVEFHFGLLPFPKYNEEQAEYYCRTFDICSPVVPVTCTDPGMAGAVLEALTFEAYYNVVPVYIDQGLQNKYVRDADSAEMVKIILDSQTELLAEIMMFDMYGNDPFNQKFMQPSEMMAVSVLEVLRKGTDKSIERMNKRYKELIEGTAEE